MSVKREILGRVTVVYLIFLVIGMLIIGRILYLQIFEKQKWTDEANSYSLQTMTIDADRGSIYTADGRLLASSVPFYEVHFDARCENLTDRLFYKGVDSLSLACRAFSATSRPLPTGKAWCRPDAMENVTTL